MAGERVERAPLQALHHEHATHQPEVHQRAVEGGGADKQTDQHHDNHSTVSGRGYISYTRIEGGTKE
jgi:hypothetical protein